MIQFSLVDDWFGLWFGLDWFGWLRNRFWFEARLDCFLFRWLLIMCYYGHGMSDAASRTVTVCGKVSRSRYVEKSHGHGL